MSLYVRVLNGFYTHRKTLRLRVAIGDAAFWVPPRIWAYASENQPDGCFQQYSADEIAMLIAYTSNAQALLQAMLQVGFMDSDPLRIHDWEEHNNYHVSFADRAKKAAAARWGKSLTPHDLKGKDRIGKDTSIPPSTASSSQQASADVPSWPEFWSFCQMVGMAAEWYAKDKFLAAEADNWDKKRNWQAYASRIRTWWEDAGRPMHPRAASTNAVDGTPRKRPPRSHVDAEWNEAEWKWV